MWLNSFYWFMDSIKGATGTLSLRCVETIYISLEPLIPVHPDMRDIIFQILFAFLHKTVTFVIFF